MSLPSPISFPHDLHRLGPDGLVATFSACELGAFYYLTLSAWSQEPPCSLPDDELLLVTFARVPMGVWQAIGPRVLLAYPWWHDVGRRYNAHARAVYDQLRAAASVRSLRARKGADVRWTGSPSDAGAPHPSLRIGPDPPALELPAPPGAAMPRACSEHAASMLGASRSAVGPRSNSEALKRLDPHELNSSASAPNGKPEPHASTPASTPTSTIADGVETIQKAAEREECFRMLSQARWGWGIEHQRTPPRDLCRRLAVSRHATAERVAFAIEEIEDIGKRWQIDVNENRKTIEDRPNPIGLLIAALGAQTRPRPPWPVPMWFQKRWEEKMGAKAARAAVQRATNELLRRREGEKRTTQSKGLSA